MKPFYIVCLLLAGYIGKVAAQSVDYNKIILPDNAQNISFEEKLVQLAWRNNPASHMAAESVDIAINDAKAVRAEWSNLIAVNGNLNEFTLKSTIGDSQNTNQFFPRYNFSVRLPLSLLIETPKKRKSAEGKIEIAKDKVNLLKLELRATVLRLYSDYKKTETIWIVRKQEMDDEESNYLLAEQKFKDGEGTVEEYIKAQRLRNQQKIQLAMAENEFVKAKVSVEEIIGLKLEDVK